MPTRQNRCLIALGAAGMSLLLAVVSGAVAGPDYYAGWAAGNLWNDYGTILRSTDSGKTWTRQGAGQIAAVNMASDGGDSWGVHNSEEYTMGISAVSSQQAWAVTFYFHGTIRHTTNGGADWTVLTELDGETLPPLWTVSFSSQPVPARIILDSGDYDGDGAQTSPSSGPHPASGRCGGLPGSITEEKGTAR